MIKFYNNTLNSTDPEQNNLVDVAIIVGSLAGVGLVVATLAYVLQRKKTVPLPPGLCIGVSFIRHPESNVGATSSVNTSRG